MKKIKQIVSIIFLIFTASFNILAQQGIDINSPVTYEIVNSAPNGAKGKIQIVNALNFEIVSETPFGDAGYIVELAKNKDNELNTAFITHFNRSIEPGLAVVKFNPTGNVSQKEIFIDAVIPTIKLAPDGLLWVILQNKSQIALIDTVSLETKFLLSSIPSGQDIVFDTAGTRAYISTDTSIMVFDTGNPKTSPKFLGSTNKIPFGGSVFSRAGELALSPDEKTLCIGRGDTITFIDAASFRTSSLNLSNNARFNILNVHFLTNKLLYVTEVDGSNIYTLDVETGLSKKVLSIRFGDIQSTKFIRGRNLLYVSHFLGTSVIDTEKGEFLLSQFDQCLSCYSIGIALSGDFSIGEPPAIQTTSPTANQQVMAGQQVTINWQTTVAANSFSIASHKIELSTDGGQTFTLIPKAERLAADVREFTWQVPDMEVLNKAQIRVSTVDLGAKRSSSTTGNFSIVKGGGGQTGDTQPPTVTFIAPRGGERFTSGDTLQISWSSSDNVGVATQDLSLSTDGGSTFSTTLASGLPASTQSFAFPIPMTLQSEQVRLRLIVRDIAGNMAQSVTPSSFSISLGADTTSPIVTISEPSANQNLIAGQPIQVRWQSTDNRGVANQALLLSLDKGQTFNQVASFGATDNSFVINNIAQLAMANAQVVVRITATDSSGNIGQANAQFSLTPAITNTTYQSKVLSIVGVGFMASSPTNSSNTTKLFINSKEIAVVPTTVSNNSLSIKANKKKLGIIKGNNTVRLVVDGIESNTLMFTF